MKRRRRRRAARHLALPVVALLIAVGVVAGAVALIVRGDTTPRPARFVRYVQPLVTAEPEATVVPAVRVATVTAPPVSTPQSLATAAPMAEATSTAMPAISVGPKLALIIDDCGQ